MADTNPNTPIPAGRWVDLYELTGIARGTQLTLDNIGTCDIYVTVQAFQPDLDHDSYNVLRRTDPRLSNQPGDEGAWAFCPNMPGKMNISDCSNDGFLPTVTPILSGSQRTDRIAEQEFQQSMLASMDSICAELRLLNARFEEAFETEVEGGDV